MAIQATAIWRVRPSGNNLNGGGYDAGISGAATDYSQQNAAQATGTNGATTGAGATTFTDATAGAFTSAMVGNCIQIASGTNFQAGFYFVVSFTNANSVVLDRSPTSGGAGSAGVWKLGGGWADFWTNPSTSAIVSGNIIYVLGSGTPNPAAYSYDYDATSQLAIAASAGTVFLANDPGTPGYKAPPDTTGGMPLIKFDRAGSIIQSANGAALQIAGLWFVTAAPAFQSYLTNLSFVVFGIEGCVFDQNNIDSGFVFGNEVHLIGCELFSSSSGGTAATFGVRATISSVHSCNIHDLIGPAVYAPASGEVFVIQSIISKCNGDGITIAIAGTGTCMVKNCTIDGNKGSGINMTASSAVVVFNNIFSNHTQAATYAVKGFSGVIPVFFDYNSFYNNTSNLLNLSQGPHDTLLGSDPYVGQATENYTLA